MISVTCALIVQNDHILAVQRSEKMKLPLKWEFPGGKVEQGENEKECLRREIKEELCLDIQVRDQLAENIHDYGHFTIRLIPFLAHIRAGDIFLTEHHTYRWLQKQELLELDWAEADIPIVHQFLNMSP